MERPATRRVYRLRPHLVGQVCVLALVAVGRLAGLPSGAALGDPVFLWAAVVVSAGAVGAFLGTLAGLGEDRSRHTADLSTVAAGILAGVAAVLVVRFLGGGPGPCLRQVAAGACSAGAGQWLAGLLGAQTALGLHAATRWAGRQLRAGWVAARRLEAPRH